MVIRSVRSLALVAFVLLSAALSQACASNHSSTTTNSDQSTTMSTTDSKTPQAPKSSWKAPITGTKLDQYTAHPNRQLVLETKLGTIRLQLFEKIAPKHVAHFISLAKSGFFNGTTFHRVMPGFMIQGGDPNSKDNDLSNDGTGEPGQLTVNAEFNEIHHARGILSTARRGDDVNSATSQFFIMVAESGFLDRQYTVWGQVIEGMDVVDKIVSLQDATSRTPAQVHDQGANPGKAAEITKAYVVGE